MSSISYSKIKLGSQSTRQDSLHCGWWWVSKSMSLFCLNIIFEVTKLCIDWIRCRWVQSIEDQNPFWFLIWIICVPNQDTDQHSGGHSRRVILFFLATLFQCVTLIVLKTVSFKPSKLVVIFFWKQFVPKKSEQRCYRNRRTN